MSTIDQPRPAAPKWNRLARDLTAAATLGALRAGDSCVGAWRELGRNRPLRVAIVWAIAAWVILELVFLVWVHRSLEGVSHRAFLPGTYFGLPAREAAAGLEGVCRFGYDGQLYYLQSNDLFGRFDAHQHIDNVMYRYQRIGVPMLAGGLATLLGYELTPPLLYHTLNFGIVAVGFGALAYWLMTNGLHPSYALGWLLAIGTIESLWRGLLDAPADGVFVLTMLAILSRRLGVYVPLASFLLLVREVYALFALAVFLATLANRFDWQDVREYWKRAVLTALPGVVMLAWTVYLTINFQMSAIEGHTNNPSIKGYPFITMFEHMGIFYRTTNWTELRLILVPAFTMLLVTGLLARGARRLPWAFLCTLPFVLMTASLGQAVWEGHGASTRVTGTVLVVGLMMMAYEKTILLRFMLALQAIAGVAWESEIRFFHPQLLSPHLLHEETPPEPNLPGSAENGLLGDLRSSIKWVDAQTTCRRKYQGAFDYVHREILPVTVEVTNLTDVTWHGGRGKHPIWLACTVLDESGQRALCRHMVILDRPIEPGQTERFTSPVELRRPHRKYQAEFSLWQGGPGWFIDADRSFGSRYLFTVE